MTENTQMLSLGQQLKNAREALGFSLSDVSHKTNLKISHLASLENDIFILTDIPPLFVRGYVRCYLNFLRLPEELIDLAEYTGETKKDVSPNRPFLVSSSITDNPKLQIRWVKILTLFILFSAIGMTFAWWQQEFEKEQDSRKQHLEAKAEQTEHTSESIGGVPLFSENGVALVSDMDQQEKLNEIAALKVGESAELAFVAPDSSHSIGIQMQPPASVNILQSTAVEEPSRENKTADQIAAMTDNELFIEIIKAQSWIMVRDQHNKRLAEKLYDVGETLTFNNTEQYHLTIGAPANVRIYYKGELVPLKVDGRVARFKLPLAN